MEEWLVAWTSWISWSTCVAVALILRPQHVCWILNKFMVSVRLLVGASIAINWTQVEHPRSVVCTACHHMPQGAYGESRRIEWRKQKVEQLSQECARSTKRNCRLSNNQIAAHALTHNLTQSVNRRLRTLPGKTSFPVNICPIVFS